MCFDGITGRAIIGLVILVLLAGCASEKTILTQQQDLFWPPPPAQAKIRYLHSFSTAEDLGIKPGFWAWLGDLITGEEINRLVRPMSVVVTADQQIYVADPGAGGVHRFDVQADKYQLITRADEKILPSPVALALGPDNSVYVADSELAKIFQIQSSKSLALRVFPQLQLHQPTGIAFAPGTGHFYIADTARHHIKVLGADGNLLKTIGQRGTAEAEFNFPTYLWLDTSERLFVTDALNFRIQIFDRDGQFLNKFGKPGDGSGNLSRPKGIAVDKNGYIFVTDALFNAVQVFNEQGSFLLPIGSRGSGEGEFWLPAGIFLNNNKLYVADSHNQRVQVFLYMGEGI